MQQLAAITFACADDTSIALVKPVKSSSSEFVLHALLPCLSISNAQYATLPCVTNNVQVQCPSSLFINVSESFALCRRFEKKIVFTFQSNPVSITEAGQRPLFPSLSKKN